MPKIEYSPERFPKLQEFHCPITQTLVENPAVAADGMFYESAEITRWLQKNENSPSTGKQLTDKAVNPVFVIAKNRDECLRGYGILTFAEFTEAVEKGNVALLESKLYLDSYVDRLSDGMPAVYRAAKNKHANMLRYLLENGANPDTACDQSKENAFALGAACFELFKEGVQLLLEHHANIHAKNSRNVTAMDDAAGRGSVELIQLVMKAGNLDVRTYLKEHGLFMMRVAVINGMSVEVVQFLINEGIDVNCIDATKFTALHCLCMYKSNLDDEQIRQKFMALVDLLLANGADLFAKDKDGLMPIDHAIKNKCQIAVDYLKNYCKKQCEKQAVMQGEIEALKTKVAELTDALTKRDQEMRAKGDEEDKSKDSQRSGRQICTRLFGKRYREEEGSPAESRANKKLG